MGIGRERRLNVIDVATHVFLPLLTQDTAVMVSAFTYGLRIGVKAPWLVALNTLAVAVDIAVFFLPTYFLSDRLHNTLQLRMGSYYERGASIVQQLGAFRTAIVMGFVMPSSAAMVVAGLLRLTFWPALSGLFIGSVAYVAIPLLIALPLASTLPAYVLPLLRWTAPAIAAVIIIVSLARSAWKRRAHAGPDTTGSSHTGQ